MEEPPNPKCIASTGALYSGWVGEADERRLNDDEAATQPFIQAETSLRNVYPKSNCFRSAQWSPDGTCVLTTSEDNKLRTFVLPVDLLESSESHTLRPYSVLSAPEPIYATAIYPHFDLSDPSRTLVVSSIRDHPIRLTNALQHEHKVCTYFLVNQMTEKYETPNSLVFNKAGTHFIAGSDSLISVFDVTRDGEGPERRIPTIPSKRKKIVGGGVGMKGTVSAMSINEDGLLAAGTYSRCVGLYGDEGLGDTVALFSIAGEEEDVGGAGITQVLWSPCGRYLYVVERKSDGALVYDIRVAGRKLGVLTGRRADTNQRMHIDIVATATGHELWSGGVDGKVRIWSNPHESEGRHGPMHEWDAHDDAVCSAAVHPTGTVLATCSGQRKPPLWENADSSDEESDDEWNGISDEDPRIQQSFDNSLKIWSL